MITLYAMVTLKSVYDTELHTEAKLRYSHTNTIVVFVRHLSRNAAEDFENTNLCNSGIDWHNTQL